MTDYTSLSDAFTNPGDVTHLKIDKDEDASEVMARLSEFTKLYGLFMQSGFEGLPKGVVAPASLKALEVHVADPETEGKLIIQTLPGLEVLKLYGRQPRQSPLPTEIGKMTKLRELHLLSCGVSELPSTMAELTSLRELYIRACPMKKFPEAITGIPHLQRLDFLDSHSRMRSLPDSLLELNELRYLDLSRSLDKKRPLPDVIGMLESLETLNLAECGITMNKVKTLQSLTQLRGLDISGHQIPNLVVLRPFSSLEELNIENCNVRDLSPLGALPKLRSLNISGNSFRGISVISGLTQLKELCIVSCRFLKNLKPILGHSTLEILSAGAEVMEKWQQFHNRPSDAVLIEQLASGEPDSVIKALEQITTLVQLNSTGEKSAAFSFFGVENAEEELVSVPVLDAALEQWGSEMPSSLLLEVIRMCMVVITENLKPTLTAIQLLVQRDDFEAQMGFLDIFRRARTHYSSGNRIRRSSLLDKLIDETFETFHPEALAYLLIDCDSNALSPEPGDAMDRLFPVALGQLDDDDYTQFVLLDKFHEYAKEIGLHDVHIKELIQEIHQINEWAGKSIDEAGLNEELLLTIAQGNWQAILDLTRHIAAQDAEVRDTKELFSYLQKSYENLALRGEWSQVKERLQFFVLSSKYVWWEQAATETIAADGLAYAQLSGDEEIAELVLQRIPDKIKKGRLAFSLACYYARKKDRESVLRYTERALRVGKSSVEFQNNEDFAGFHEDAGFKALLDDIYYTPFKLALTNPAKVTLVWVEEDEHPGEFLDRLSEFTNLRALDMRNGFEKLPRGVVAPASLTELRVKVANLETECRHIIKSLPELECLDIQGQKRPGTVPTTIRKMTKLRFLRLRSFPFKKLPEATTGIPHLQHLSFWWTSIGSLPDSLEKMQELQQLDLRGSVNMQLKPIPVVIGTLKSLEILNLQECCGDHDLKALNTLPKLRQLNISNGKMSSLSGLRSSSLEELDMSCCKEFRDLRSLSELPNLRSLDLSRCDGIEDISGISSLTRLKKLNICSLSLKDLRPILKHPTLETLIASDEIVEKWQARLLAPE